MLHEPIRKVTRKQLMVAVARARVPILLEFYTSWCPACDRVTPVLERLRAALGSSARILRVDADRETDLVREFGIGAVPTFVFLRKRRVTGVLTGSQSFETLRSELRRAGTRDLDRKRGKLRSHSA
jgi:thioredoxin-like negative regulator of GroEL